MLVETWTLRLGSGLGLGLELRRGPCRLEVEVCLAVGPQQHVTSLTGGEACISMAMA